MSDSSRMPDGGYVPTFGSNLLLDSFDFDTEYGEGPANTRKNPDPDLPRSQNGLAALPDGFLGTERLASDDDLDYHLLEAGDEGGLGDLSSLVKSATRLVDLSWLESAEQDPDRLPENPSEKMLGELAEAWGVDRRTDGIHLIPNVEYPEPPPSATAGLPGDPRPAKMTLPLREKFRDIVAHAMRLSALGEPLDRIAEEVAALSGAGGIRDPKLASALRSVRAEHGAVGKVYLRDSAFPGLLTGKWDGAIKKRCASARYWLTTPGSKLAAYENYLGKSVVTAIPWAEALDHYRPMLEATGRKLASGDPKAALLSALARSERKSHKASAFHVQPNVDPVTLQQARRLFAAAPVAARQVFKQDLSLVTQKKAVEQFAAWQKSGLISEGDARKILAHKAEPVDYLRAGAAWIAASGKKVASYDGQGVGVTVPSRDPKLAASTEIQNGELRALVRERTRQTLASFVKSGSLTPGDAKRILASGLSPKEMVRVAQQRATEAVEDDACIAASSKKVAYEGQGVGMSVAARATKGASWAEGKNAELRALVRDRARKAVASLVKSGSLASGEAKKILASDLSPEEMVRAAEQRATQAPSRKYAGVKVQGVERLKAPTVKVALSDPMTARVIKWASVQMNEGFAGNDLDQLLSSRFAEAVLKKADASLVQLRKKHEGLAGHVYVDANVYASANGVTGCESGALIHRANQIKSVLKMARCSSCSSAVEGSCQKYSKQLVTAAPVKNPEKYQREMIRLANGTDAESTASLFTNYDAGEFDLQNDNLDSFDYDDSPAPEYLSDVIFGGMDLSEI